MEINIKKTVKAGNSSAVILPRAWLNKEVRVELVKKNKRTILFEVLEILEKNISLEEIIGIYLVGSYARGEEDEGSDVDVLVITKGVDREVISNGVYNVLVASSELINQKLDTDLFPIGQMIKEAEPLINSNYLENFEIKVTKKNVSWYLKTTKDKLKLIRKILNILREKHKTSVDNSVVYTLVLRMKTLYIIECLVKNKRYLKKDFIKLVREVSGSRNSYESYLRAKSDLRLGKKVGLDEAYRLYAYLEKQMKKIKSFFR